MNVAQNSPELRTVDAITDVLAGEIVAGMHKPGENLPAEVHLAERFAVSRPTIRNVLKKLAGKGLTSSRRGSGHCVTRWWENASPAVLTGALERLPLTSAAGRSLVSDVLEARIEVACTLARQLSRRRDDRLLAEAGLQIAQITRPDQMLVQEAQLYAAYTQALPNLTMRMTIYGVLQPAQLVLQKLNFIPAEAQQHLDEIKKIHRCIEMTMEPDAVELTRAHLTRLDLEIRRALLG